MAPSSLKEARTLFDTVKNAASKMRSVEVLLAVPALFIADLSSGYKGNKIEFAAQAISIYEDKAHTGYLSAPQFVSSGASHCLIGHSESGDSLDDLRIKTFMAIKNDLTPVVFIGESTRDQAGKYLDTVREQMSATLQELSTSQIDNVIFCYEPVWAVGSSESLDAYGVHAMALYIRKVLVEDYGAAAGRKAKVLYGGSVNTSNITDILEIEDLDGVAVGRTSIDKVQFVELLKIANKA